MGSPQTILCTISTIVSALQSLLSGSLVIEHDHSPKSGWWFNSSPASAQQRGHAPCHPVSEGSLPAEAEDPPATPPPCKAGGMTPVKKASSLVGEAAPVVRTSERQTQSARGRLRADRNIRACCTGDEVCCGIPPDACGASAGDDGAFSSGVDAFAGEMALLASDSGRDPDGRGASRRCFSGEGSTAPTPGEPSKVDAFAGELTPVAGDVLASAVGTLIHWRWGPCTRSASLANLCVCRWALASWRRHRDSRPRREKPPTPCFSRRCLNNFVREGKCTTFTH